MMVIMRVRAAIFVVGALLAGCDLVIGLGDLVYTGPDGAADAPGPDVAPPDATDDLPLAVDAGCEADVASDPKNCGACGHDCLGGACDAGACQPALVTTGAALAALASDGTTLFLRDNGAIHSCAVYGCADAGAVLATTVSPAVHRRVRVAGADVLWNEGPHLYACAKTACSQLDRLTANTLDVFDFWVSSSVFYLAQQSGGAGPYPYRIGSCPLPSGACVTLTSGATDYLDVIAGSGLDFYWTVPATTTVNYCHSACGVDASTASTSFGGLPRALSVDGTGVWLALSNGVDWLSPNLAAGTPIVSTDYMTAIVHDGPDVYFIDASKYRVDRCPATADAGACTPTVLRQAGGTIDDIAVDANAVYWIEGESNVWRLAR
jgi:hypothetical protein